MGLIKKVLNKTADFAGDLLGRVTGSKQANEQAALNNAFQADYATNQVQYRVRDALKAGINPLAALGISGGYQPMFQNSTTNDANNVIDSIGSLAGGLGKGISKLFVDQEKESRELSLENQRLENDYIRAQIDHLRNLNPGATGGSYSSGVKTDRNSGPQKTVPAEDWLEGENPAHQIIHTRNGDMVVPSSMASDSLDVEFEGGNPYAWEYFLRDKSGQMINWWKNKTKIGRAEQRLKKRGRDWFLTTPVGKWYDRNRDWFEW